MKHLYFSLIFISIACQSAWAQTDLQLNLNHFFGTEAFELNTESTNNVGESFTVARLDYYLSSLEVVHDGGTITPISDVYLLVKDGGNIAVSLGNEDVTYLEGINFNIGVDPDHNHLDPSTYDAEHPLAPQNPNMHWGWASGYKFIAVEGDGNSGEGYEYHGLGDDNYFPVHIPLDSQSDNGWIEINIEADIDRLFEDMDLDTDLIVHSETGKAKLVLENMRDHVFYDLGPSTDIDNKDLASQIKIYPNPTSNGATTLKIQTETSEFFDIKVLDILGQEVSTQKNLRTNTPQTIQVPKTGLYIANIIQDGHVIASKKIISQ